MSYYYQPTPIRSRSLAEMYLNKNPPSYLYRTSPSSPRQPIGHLAEALRSIAEAKRDLEKRYPKAELPTREEIESKIKDNPDKKVVIEISGKKFDIDFHDQRLISMKDHETIPFDHLESKEERKLRSKEKNKIEKGIDKGTERQIKRKFELEIEDDVEF